MNYHNIERGNILNGDGVRCVIWVSGCDHNCKNCQNPQTHDPNSGIPFDDNAMKEILDILEDKFISGITFSGGDPLYPQNIPTICNVIKKIKTLFPEKTIWIYTGYTFETLLMLRTRIDELDYILQNTDVLVDGRYVEELSSVEYPWAGSTNQNVIDCKKSIKCNAVILHKTP